MEPDLPVRHPHTGAKEVSRTYVQATVRSPLQDVGVSSAAALLATSITDRQGLQQFVGQ